MKALRFMVCAIMALSISLTAMSQSRVFNNYSDNKDISTVYISKAAMRLGLSMAGSESNMKDMMKCIKNPEGMEVITASSPEAIAIVKKDSKVKIKNLGLDLILDVNDDGENVNIYAGKMADDGIMRDLLIETSEDGEYTIVYIRGEIDANSLTKLFNK